MCGPRGGEKNNILFMQAKHLSLSQRPEFVLHWPLKHTIALNTCIQYRKCLLACCGKMITNLMSCAVCILIEFPDK